MAISLFFFFLFMRLFAEINGGSQDECKMSRCSHKGPVIRFPFWLKDHPDSCGCPGFELSCSEKKQTMLELPYSVKLSVEKINYTSQEIFVRFPDYCLQRQILNLNLSASPFQFPDKYSIYDFTFFNCSESKSELNAFSSVPCSFLSSNPVYVTPSICLLSEVNLTSCRKIFNATVPQYIFYREYDFSMNWLNPMCGSCEADGKKCQRKKNNSTEPEIECIDKPEKSLLSFTGGPIDKMVPKVIFHSPMLHVILGFLHLTFGIFIIFIVYRSNRLKREHKINVQKFLEDYKALKLLRYSYADIKKITNNFKNKLSQGGYGTIYKGKLSNEVFVVIKIFNDFKGNGEEFINEVRTIGTIHHINVLMFIVLACYYLKWWEERRLILMLWKTLAKHTF
ncbi:hypothetical protein PVL29_021651 [Vitis rotundifolia]|uniref:RING-type E3 ubiquitin transferase n=1 Tax=Vitis rotundifolia TaxID=103349 RepID=A0AA38Z083_VITRO|nr:hypothetical protein PVL29_021651 [Vitis rotundifolia]